MLKSLCSLISAHKVIGRDQLISKFRNLSKVPNRKPKSIFPSVDRNRINAQRSRKLLACHPTCLEVFF